VDKGQNHSVKVKVSFKLEVYYKGYFTQTIQMRCHMKRYT